MDIHVLTLFPGAFDSFLAHSMMKRAVEKGRVKVTVHDLRDYTHDKHRTADDRPFGGGPGMLMKPEPIFEAVDKLFPPKADPPTAGATKKRYGKKARFVYLTPSGKKFDQKTAAEFAQCDTLVLLCGHYEGVDQRVVDELVTDEVSIGDYVLTQGELPAMVLVDAVVRLIPGVLGCAQSKEFESFTGNLLEYPQYTRPAVYRGLAVPKVLLSGDHQKVAEWRKKQSQSRTRKHRPDLLDFKRRKK